MSTRCNVLVKDKYSEQWFYRHSDGYPSCTVESLKKFIQWLEDKKIRNNVSQGSPWLIVLGNQEYADDKTGGGEEPTAGIFGWKVGAYELTDGKHGDIVWLYTIDLEKEKVTVEYVYDDSKKVFTFKQFLKCNPGNLENKLSA